MALRFHEWIEYTKQMNSHVKFKFDHEAIRDEYLEHMEDMYEFYVGRGMDPDLAKSAVLEDMGDPDELGRVLNQIHNPVLGWIWRLSRWLVVLLIGVLICTHGLDTYNGLFLNKTWSRQKADLAYTVDVDEKRVLDYRTVYFDRLEVYEDGMAHQFGKAGQDMTFGPFGRYLEMMQDFAAIVRGEYENRFSYDYELAVQRLLLQACGNWKEN